MKYAAIIGAVVALAAAAPAASGTQPGPRLDIPAIGVHTTIVNPGHLDEGPMWWPFTGRPGRNTTIAIAGHRTTHTHPFMDLNKLHRGDRIRITYGGRYHYYAVKRVYIRSASDGYIARATDYERLLLTACSNPDGTPTSLSYRIVVWAKPIDK